MKTNLATFLALGATLMLCATQAQATRFNFSWTDVAGIEDGGLTSSNQVSGSFEGTANGNLVSNLSNISVFINGVAFNKNGELMNYAFKYNEGDNGWVSDIAQVSFDGTENNFLFVDDLYNTDFTSNFFRSQSAFNETAACHWWSYSDYVYISDQLDHRNWKLTQADVPEPASPGLLLLGLACVAGIRRQTTASRAKKNRAIARF
jgi:hypothetical protein